MLTVYLFLNGEYLYPFDTIRSIDPCLKTEIEVEVGFYRYMIFEIFKLKRHRIDGCIIIGVAEYPEIDAEKVKQVKLSYNALST